MKNDDVAIIRRVLAGDEAAFAELVNKYQKPVHTLAWRKIGDFHIAEDITQDAFLNVYQRLSTLKDPNQFSGWLYVITTNLCATWLRKKRIQTQPLEDTETTMIQGDVYSQHVTEERSKTASESQREVVKQLLAKLKESERTVMTLHYLGEMTVAEISRFLGVSTSTIKSRLRRARNRLKEEEPMIREALDHFQITPNLTENIMREISRLKPIAPPGSKPLVPWAIGVSTLAIVLLMLGIGNQQLLRFQKPYSFEATSEMTVEIIEAPVVLNLEAKPAIRTQLGGAAASNENDASEKQPNDNPVLQNSQTWSLPENAIARFGKGVMGGSDRAVAFSPDGKRFAVATGAGIWLYDAQTYREISLLTGHTGVVRAVAFSSDGKTLASGARDRTIKLWNLETGDVTTCIGHRGGVESVAFSFDGQMIVSGAVDSTIELWDTETGQNLATFTGHASRVRVFSVAFSPDGKTVASGAEDNTIKLWDVETRQNTATLTGHKKVILSVAFSPDGKILASGSGDDTVKLWHVETGQNLHTFKHRDRVFSVAFSPDGKLVAGGSYRGIKLWDIETGEDLSVLEEGTKVISGSIAFSPDGGTLVSASADRFGGTRGTVTLWDVETGKDLATLHGHTERIPDVAFSSDGTTIASSLRDGTVKLWNIKTGENIHTYRGGGFSVAFSPDGKTLASAGWRDIKLWEVATQKNISTISIRGERINGLAFSPDSKGLAWGTGDQVKLRKHVSKPLFGFMNPNAITLKGHKDEVRSVAFSPDGKILASSVRYGTVRLWDTETGANIATLEEAGGPVVFSPDGKLLASSGPVQAIKLWDLETRTDIMTLRGKAGAVFDLKFSPDGTTLVSGEGFGTIKFWDVVTGENIDTLEGHTGIVFSVEFSPDGKTLTSGSQDGTVLLWDLKQVADR
ncbi:sigma-70 family RNA polymerase sigma factor [Candidatus Poribacteria bacterium]|nr:sigma-70 family RNA polymerase sigma factor [Candidatus Poribacteria bacterium]